MKPNNTKGHAYLDYYATYYDSPNDPVHIHEATHQIFLNRLFLPGGGSWFQEGLAEYMCTSRSARRSSARPGAKKGRGPRILRMARKDQIDARDYLPCASVIDFLLNDKRFSPKFPVFLRRMGVLVDPTPKRVETLLTDIYGMNVDSLEQGWIRYWKR